MAKATKQSQYLSLQAMFEQGNISKMRDIEKLFPTKVARDLGINHGRYIDKLYNPQRFTFDQVNKFASLLGIDPGKISKVIFNELADKAKATKTKNYISKSK